MKIKLRMAACGLAVCLSAQPAVAGPLEDGSAAYERGDYFEAHEDLEPAWMGTDDPGERAYLQGLIKLAAAYVHGVRGNPTGIRRNLEGARARLAEALETGGGAAADLTRIDLPALISEIDRRRSCQRRHGGCGAPVLSGRGVRDAASDERGYRHAAWRLGGGTACRSGA